MITTFLLSLSSYVVSAILYLLPDSSGLPSQVTSALSVLSGYVGILDPILPISTLAVVFSLVIAFELAVFAFKTLRWLIGFVPFVGSSK